MNQSLRGRCGDRQQKHVVDNNQNYDSIDWTTADPVTGTVARYNYTSAGDTRFKEETEPLGQKISNEDTADAPTPQNGGPVGRADDPEWQCQAPQQFYGTFSALPEHCQRSLLRDLNNSLEKIYFEQSPQMIITFSGVHTPGRRPGSPDGLRSNPSQRIMSRSLSATSKKTGDDDDGEPKTIAVVNIPILIDMKEIPGFVDTSVSEGQIQTKTVPFDVPRIDTALGKVLDNQGCKDFIANLLNIASKNTNKKLAENGDILKMFQLAKNNLTRERPKGFDPTAGGTVLGSFKKKNAGIFVVGSPSKDAKDQFSVDVTTILHELIHLAAFKGDYFSDPDLADIISKSPDGKIPYTGDNAVYPNNPYDPKYTREQASSMKSGYWDRVLAAKCFTDKDGKDLDVRTLVNW